MTSHLMPTYATASATFVRGRGTILWDTEGKRYLDFLGGMAVVCLGHAHPAVAAAVAEQARTLVHVSNFYGSLPGERLAAELDTLLGGDGLVFFANSGAEANECAIKLARKRGGSGKHVVISALGSNHGRTLATLHASGEPAKHRTYQPLPEGFRHVPWHDLDALATAFDPTVGAVLLEPVQGAAGVRPATAEYLHGVRRLCDEYSALLIMDEVQTGLGRTGRWFGHQHFGVRPDVVTVAKALGNGVPIGACWARREVANSFTTGDHATTFGGQPLASSAGLAVLSELRRIDAPASARRAGERLARGLRGLAGVREVRGLGLLVAAELADGHDADEVSDRALAAGLVVNAVTDTALRFAPPLTVTDDEIDEALAILGGVLA
ncbi:acetylornithine/succinylornithine family transaminase [Amycolatopsis sp. A133]|uniref:aspartate aminotransferase family protein n=1 Tax=Amycolatopsis sp. A133 TaxID=3064472 RepID=UPI0027E848FC|nr:acetylornithine/succinylornithine family transaminase [Amycolatopsis sp. A133]MDQ7803477.1 acetylornithine/succinylornithine family transaminase [Amycolatopsis sp. A133]